MTKKKITKKKRPPRLVKDRTGRVYVQDGTKKYTIKDYNSSKHSNQVINQIINQLPSVKKRKTRSNDHSNDKPIKRSAEEKFGMFLPQIGQALFNNQTAFNKFQKELEAIRANTLTKSQIAANYQKIANIPEKKDLVSKVLKEDQKFATPAKIYTKAGLPIARFDTPFNRIKEEEQSPAPFLGTPLGEENKNPGRDQLILDVKKIAPEYTFDQLGKMTTLDLLELRNEKLPGNKGSGCSKGKSKCKNLMTNLNKPLYDTELMEMLSPYRDFVGVIMRDELPKLLNKMLKDGRETFGFIINTSDSNNDGEHWQAIYVDTDRENGSIEFYDSYGDDPSDSVKNDLKKFAKNFPWYLKFKINKVKHQIDKSNRCGFHSANFLIDRFKNRPFTEATEYSGGEVGAGLSDMEYRLFGYI